MTKAILFDVDGIVIVGRKQFFSIKLAEQQGVPSEKVSEFFLGNFKKCSFGKADLKEEIAPFLPKWNWQGSVDDLLKFWFEAENEKDENVLKIISELRARGIKCYIATRQEKYRLDYLMNGIDLKDHFDGAFCTCNIGYDKKEPEFFHHVFKELDLKPEEIMFFDDSQTNVDNANSLGIKAYFYNGIDVLKDNTKDLLG
jgi:putative hydrolase of the HAD superfamily